MQELYNNCIQLTIQFSQRVLLHLCNSTNHYMYILTFENINFFEQTCLSSLMVILLYFKYEKVKPKI